MVYLPVVFPHFKSVLLDSMFRLEYDYVVLFGAVGNAFFLVGPTQEIIST